ncbi:MAG TPA: hypothetical protein ENK44_16010 [Caldithrix abyssi]|uniref:Uncharacterized protein n=1 Tax=Caldithrix abyssi TaxID=187145 RepID=A0A7V4WWA2_CALAY|nr:hypothetical protein [Caldithrix abyssi]
MKEKLAAERRLQWLLYLMAIHSFGVGIGLILQPESLMRLLGFPEITQPFFPAQGGIFHLIMAAAYFLAGRDRNKYNILITFSIFVKTTATLFLFTFYIFIEAVPLIILSAVGDGMMALLLYLFYRSVKDKASVKNK